MRWEGSLASAAGEGNQLLNGEGVAIHPPGTCEIDAQSRIDVHVGRCAHLEQWHYSGLDRILW